MVYKHSANESVSVLEIVYVYDLAASETVHTHTHVPSPIPVSIFGRLLGCSVEEARARSCQRYILGLGRLKTYVRSVWLRVCN